MIIIAWKNLLRSTLRVSIEQFFKATYSKFIQIIRQLFVTLIKDLPFDFCGAAHIVVSFGNTETSQLKQFMFLLKCNNLKYSFG